ncbi:RsmB/NOP family class I SAM-dependent RNA methyltransferase [Rariglobus hedericola]|uniref:RsmB/NOP family class I SAM-dependent RNA methyltransferase n=1 Tax=Rariglobus hedericola TaxID=2597822 RepID=A0A556QEN2_9BACT|nr:RsmB/NOP family class I SAM-dependent RNA methyltransferase [Rariglobus hedericola]TSJ75110.1 RsmB/NOP family class I SAM-dependent RNA methyltransferase [Rariglobus hedericola]
MTKPFKPGLSVDAWALAVELLVRWLENNERVDVLLDSLPRSLGRAERGRCQHLLFGAVRNLGRIEAIFTPMLARPPRTAVKAILLIAGYELIEGGNDGHTARVVHHAVEQTKTLASQPEAKMVNAVVRKISAALDAQTVPAALAGATELANYYSHPEWLVRRWLAQFGAAGARELLEWNQKPAPVYARWRAEGAPAGEDAALFVATPWKGFYEVKSGSWARVETLVNDGTLFLQDPATRHAIDLLAPKTGEAVLDACAAPGGKSLAIADLMGSGRVVAVDLPSPRIDRLKQNLSRAKIDVALVQADLLQIERLGVLEECNLPKAYDAVLLDVPCSNTGVMRHRVDVKWRLQVSDFAKHARQQGDLLSAAARLVVPGGRLVYSTCSLDTEENMDVISTFLEKTRGRFTLEAQRISQPWVDGHDGAAAFVLRKAVG